MWKYAPKWLKKFKSEAIIEHFKKKMPFVEGISIFYLST